jgi:hypothetical protein
MKNTWVCSFLSIRTAAMCCLLAVTQLTPTAALTQPYEPPQREANSRGLIALLWFTIKSQLVHTLANNTTNAANSGFNSLFSKLSGNQVPAAPMFQPQSFSGYATTASSFTAVAPPPPTAEQQAQGVAVAIQQPTIAIKAVFLSGPEPDAGLHPLRGDVTIKTQEGQPVTMDVYSGDVFAVYFTPSTPGLVRLTSDERGKVVVLDTYAVRPGLLNRLPRQGAGGILVDDEVGTEILRVEFEPCLPDALKGESTIQPFVGKLGACTLFAGGSVSVASRSVRSDAARGLALSIPAGIGITNAGFISTGKDYRAGQSLTHDVVINHLPHRN